MERTRDVLDYYSILESFKRKWNTKYSTRSLVQEAYKNALIANSKGFVPQAKLQATSQVLVLVNSISLREAMAIWSLSQSRLMCLSLAEFRPKDSPESIFCGEIENQVLGGALQQIPLF